MIAWNDLKKNDKLLLSKLASRERYSYITGGIMSFGKFEISATRRLIKAGVLTGELHENGYYLNVKIADVPEAKALAYECAAWRMGWSVEKWHEVQAYMDASKENV
jgi:hypothetical protein